MCRTPPNICPWHLPKSHGLQGTNTITENILKYLEQKPKWMHGKLTLKLHFYIEHHLTFPVTSYLYFFITYILYSLNLVVLLLCISVLVEHSGMFHTQSEAYKCLLEPNSHRRNYNDVNLVEAYFCLMCSQT